MEINSVASRMPRSWQIGLHTKYDANNFSYTNSLDFNGQRYPLLRIVGFNPYPHNYCTREGYNIEQARTTLLDYLWSHYPEYSTPQLLMYAANLMRDLSSPRSIEAQELMSKYLQHPNCIKLPTFFLDILLEYALATIVPVQSWIVHPNELQALNCWHGPPGFRYESNADNTFVFHL